MKMLKIVTDSSADMPPGWAEKYRINILPINIQFGDRTYRQGIDLTNDQFYELVEQTQKIPKTSLPTPAQIIEFYQKIAKVGDSILSIHVSGKLSGTINMVEEAAREVADRFKVTPFDSGGGSAMLAYLCQEARVLDKAGATIQDILDRLEFIKRKITIIFTVDTLGFRPFKRPGEQVTNFTQLTLEDQTDHRLEGEWQSGYHREGQNAQPVDRESAGYGQAAGW